MTTIAYKDNAVAWDSRKMRGNHLILSDNCNKLIVENGVYFWGVGSTTDIQKLIDAYPDGKGIAPPVEANLLVFDKGSLFRVGFNPDSIPPEYWLDKLDMDHCDAFGSGEDHALTAMDMGATAKEAVEFAAKRDPGTGGKIHFLDLSTITQDKDAA